MCRKLLEEVARKYEVEVRGPEWRMVQKIKKISALQMKRRMLGKIFSWFREYILQRKQGMQEGHTEKEEMRQQQRGKVMKDMTKKIRAKERMDGNHSWWVCELLATDCEKAWLHSGWEDPMQKWRD